MKSSKICYYFQQIIYVIAILFMFAIIADVNASGFFKKPDKNPPGNSSNTTTSRVPVAQAPATSVTPSTAQAPARVTPSTAQAPASVTPSTAQVPSVSPSPTNPLPDSLKLSNSLVSLQKSSEKIQSDIRNLNKVLTFIIILTLMMVVVTVIGLIKTLKLASSISPMPDEFNKFKNSFSNYVTTNTQGTAQGQKIPGDKLDTILAKLVIIDGQLNRNFNQLSKPDPTNNISAVDNRLSMRNDKSIKELCSMYNEANRSIDARNDFEQKYNQIRLEVANAMERRTNPRLEPNYQISQKKGDYLAIQTADAGIYAIVPSFGVIQDFNYGTGALGIVFDCPNFDPKFKYRNVEILRPAFFETDMSKQKWTLKQTGSLNLGQGEP
jgi:hypothetical protein